MRILMLAQFYPPMIGGEERHVRDLALALSARGHEVAVATMWQKGLPDQQDDRGVHVYRLHGLIERLAKRLYSEAERPHAPPFADPELTTHLAKLIRTFQPDVVHAHNWLLHSFLPLKRPHGPRLVVTLHDLSLVCATKTGTYENAACEIPTLAKCASCAARHYGTLKGAVTLGCNLLSGFAERRLVDKFLTVSNAIAELSGLPGGPTDYEVVPNFVRDDIATLDQIPSPLLAQLPAEPYILFVGDQRRVKGIDVLLDAYRRLNDVPPLVVIGRPRQGEQPNWPAHVQVFDNWPHQAVMQAWSRCLVGVVPSVCPEACATVVLEAMSLGKPVVASRIGGMPDLISHGFNGLLFRPGDSDELARAIDKLLNDGAMRRALGTHGQETVTKFKASAVVSRIEAIYHELIFDQTGKQSSRAFCQTYGAVDRSAGARES